MRTFKLILTRRTEECAVVVIHAENISEARKEFFYNTDVDYEGNANWDVLDFQPAEIIEWEEITDV